MNGLGKKGLLLCWDLRNLCNHLDRQAHKGDTVLVKSREMTGGSQTRDTHLETGDPACGFLPSLLGEGDKGNEIVYGEEKNIFYWVG